MRRISMTNVAYVLFLLVFVSLGMFVYALAVGSGLVSVIGPALLGLLIATAVGFRIGARKRAESNDSGIEIPGENIWARPLRREQIDRYLESYRGAQTAPTVAVEPTPSIDRCAA